jgi:hypothetical protein
MWMCDEQGNETSVGRSESGDPSPDSTKKIAIKIKSGSWKVPSELSKEYPGSHLVLRERLQALRERLIKDLVSAGCSPESAIQLVEDNLIGLRIHARGRPTLAASPDAIRIFEQDELRRQTKRAEQKPSSLSKPDNWRTAGELASEYSGGFGVILERLKGLRESFIDRLAAAGYSIEEASQFVNDFLIGYRHPKDAPVQTQALVASPTAISMAEQERQLVPKRTVDSKRSR